MIWNCYLCNGITKQAMSRKNIKLRIREILAQKGMTNKALADKMGVLPQHISNILSGRSLSVNALVKVADALGVQFGDLFVSSFTPNTPFENEFVAMVKCRRGIFTASSLNDLQDVVNTLSNRANNATELMKRTLERMLRFPSGKDNAIISELMANLSLCMNPNEWIEYYKTELADLLPANFQVDYRYLSTFMTQDDMLELERSMA